MITSSLKGGMKLIIHYQTSIVVLLKFVNGETISAHTLLGMWLFIHAGINSQPVLVKEAPVAPFTNMV